MISLFHHHAFRCWLLLLFDYILHDKERQSEVHEIPQHPNHYMDVPAHRNHSFVRSASHHYRAKSRIPALRLLVLIKRPDHYSIREC